MPLFRSESTVRECRVDFAVQVLTILVLTAVMMRQAPAGQRTSLAMLAAGGLVAWTLIEYCVHRFVLHGLRPWRAWHGLHHRLPATRIIAPTILVSALFATLVFAPLAWLAGTWLACGFTVGVLCGYLIYSFTHHAIHHCNVRGSWLRRRQQWHFAHHRTAGRSGRYGVTTELWDHVFLSAA